MNNPLFVKESELKPTRFRKQLIEAFVKNKGFNTFYDKECKDLQCERGRYRSITELHQIVLSRFPKTTFNAILRIIKEIIDDGDGSIQMVFCTQVEKVVLKYIGESASSYVSKHCKTYYYNNKGVDGYSAADYDQIIKELTK